MATPVQTGPAFAASFREGQGQIEYDIPQDLLHCIYTRDFTTPVANYAAATFSDVDPGGVTDPSCTGPFYLIAPEQVVWTDGIICKYSRKYANLPTTPRYEWESYQVDYPGFSSVSSPSSNRQPFRLIVPTAVVYQYAWLGPGALNPAGGMTAALAATLYGSPTTPPPTIPSGFLTASFNPFGLAFLTDTSSPSIYTVNSTSKTTWTMCISSTMHRLYGWYYESVTRLAPYY